ncbi:hypothetical protein [Leucothrix arctica]|uniref:Uncharacterized protein n=1 Tax=Leucothrix arctica TaxID=1481894 RepID=A0A317CCP3_9GAMM|nr:hypothetical protein [Leucothrix arctica]PWQ96318.1 hypothetical protein DKT75_10050 [Leucothrix arctica]
MNNKAHTILVSVMASYGSKLTTSTASCKAFLADFLTDYADEKNVLVELHHLQLTKALYTFKGDAIDKKTLIEFIDQIEARSDLSKQELAWGVDAWANAVDIDIKARRMIRKQCFSHTNRDLHMVTIRPIEMKAETVPEVPAMVVENASQAALPRMALMGVVTLISTFSIFQAIKSKLPIDTAPAPVAIVQPIKVDVAPIAIKAPLHNLDTAPVAEKTPEPLPKVVVIAPRSTSVAIEPESSQISHRQDKPEPIDIEKLSGKLQAEQAAIEVPETSIEFAAADTTELPEVDDEKLQADIEAFLTQD